ncbi:hypothetical protein K440DRAFT_550127 [Wilcoxina mikolae CBS 423.85]|nr:hypothetical protein K440DRAFT_550127 [Wilcoxina mikolae CBS 423.85]
MPVKHTAQTNGTSNLEHPPIHESSGPVPGGDSAPTESHALATADHEEKGISQLHGQQTSDAVEVKDLGWNEPPEKVPAPLVGGLPNEELWMLVRRFNKQMYHVKATPHLPPGGLDLNVAAEDEFSPDKLRSNVERLYMTVIVGMAGFAKHIARLRSWAETKRTAAFCSAYFVAWALDLLMPLIISTLIALVVYPRSRDILFPPAPLALVDASTGGVKKPTAGVLGSYGSLTGAPEKHHGEAVEQEAHNFVSSFGAIALSSAAGEHPDNKTQQEDSKAENSVPDPTEFAMKAADAKDSAGGGDTSTKQDTAKKPVEEAMWEKARPVMHIIGDIADTWERFANALSPTSPFPKDHPRLKLAGAVLVPLLVVSIFVDAYMVAKGTTFFIGAGFFGDPLISRGLAWLNANVPNWQEYLDIRNSLLRGVPTNAQLTITLLRIGEASKAPLPPPPSENVSAPPTHAAKPLDSDEIPLEASQSEVEDAIHPDAPPVAAIAEEESKPEQKGSKAKKLLSFFKGTTKTGVNTALSTDPIKASAGSKAAQNRLGAVPSASAEPPSSGPVVFPCRHHGKKGVLYIITSAASPCVSFSYEKHQDKPEFVVAIPEIREIKKVGGLGWKSKLVVGWSMDRNVVDAIEIVDKDGKEWLLTAVHLRDELFNRLVAMGGQKWESW